MVTWLPRSLLFIIAGAVLAYAVTVHVEQIDLQTTGVILLLVGIFDLLLNVGITLYLRPHYPRPGVRRPDAGPAQIPGRRAPGPTGDRTADDSYATRPLPRDPDWH